MVFLQIQNNSTMKYLYRRQTLEKLAETICKNEKIKSDVEVSLLFCDDPFIQSLNMQYAKDEPTDVLSFQQEGFPMKGLRCWEIL